MTNEEALDELNVIYERLSHPEDCEQGVYSFRDGDYLEALDMVIKALEQQPTRPTGRWINVQYFKADDTYYRPKCPFCSIEPKEYSNFCPNCGARMIESEE